MDVRQRLAELIGVSPADVSIVREAFATEVAVQAGGHTYYNSVTDRALLAHPDALRPSSAMVTCAGALWGMLVADGHLSAVRCKGPDTARAVEAALGWVRAAAREEVDGMDSVLNALGRVIEARSTGKTHQLRSDLELLAGVALAWALTLTDNPDPEDRRG